MQFIQIPWNTVLSTPAAIVTYNTDTDFFDPATSGNFTITVFYGWSSTNTQTYTFNLEVINPCFSTNLLGL
jgi:hypothetical protein